MVEYSIQNSYFELQTERLSVLSINFNDNVIHGTVLTRKIFKVSAVNQIVFEIFLFAWIYRSSNGLLSHSTHISLPTIQSQ